MKMNLNGYKYEVVHSSWAVNSKEKF